MLGGKLSYNDTQYGWTEFEVTALPLADGLQLSCKGVSPDGSDFYKLNNIMHRSELKPEFEEKGVGSCRIDIGKSIKTNAVNLQFASHIGTVIKYSLSISTGGSPVIEDENGVRKELFVAQENIENAQFKVVYHCGIPTYFAIKTEYVILELQEVQSDVIFRPLKAKDKWGNTVSTTPISIMACKMTKDNLGFSPKSKVVDIDIPSFGMYQTIEEVIAAHPDKSTDWILDREYQIANKDNFEELLKEFEDYDGMIAFDTETTGLNITFKSAQGEGDTLTGVVLSKKKGTGVYFPVGHKQFENLCDGDIDYFMQTYMKKILETKPIICHNTSFDWKVAYLYGINTNVVFDTMVAFQSTLRYVYGKNYETGLKALAKKILGLDMFELEDFVIGDWGTDVNFSMLPYELVRRYAPADGDMTLSLYEWIKDNQLLEQYNAVRVHDLEVQFAKVVAYSEYWGYKVDIERLPNMIKETRDSLEVHRQNMFNIIGREFNPNSPKQLTQIMYDELGIEKIGGQTSTKAEILEELAKITNEDGSPKYPFVIELLAYRSHEGTEKNFIKKRDDFVTKDGFVFPHIFAFGTNTGRVSIKEPNYQSYDKLVKHYITPRQGYLMFDCDFSQIEYRVLASMAGQQNLCDALEDPDMDYHTYQAARMFNVPYASVTPSLRSQSKGINFGLPYGMEDKSLGKRIFGRATPENTAKAANLRKKYFQGQEKILNFFEVVRAQGVSKNYTETWLGRRRYYDKNRFDTHNIRRQAGNHVIQGSAADIYKMAVVSLFNRICQEGWLGKVLFNAFVHDELLCEIHSSISPYKFLKVWREEYQVKIKGFCSLFAGAGFGRNWYEAKSQDLPPAFIDEYIQKSDTLEWNGDIDSFLLTCIKDYSDYKVRRVKEYLLDKSNDGQVIKPLINSLMIEELADNLGVKEKELIKSYSNLSDRVSKFCECFGVDELMIVGVLPPEDVKTSEDDANIHVSIPTVSKTEALITTCKEYGVAIDVDALKVYLRFEPTRESLMTTIKSMVSNEGYTLMFMVFESNQKVKVMSTPYKIGCSEILDIKKAYGMLGSGLNV